MDDAVPAAAAEPAPVTVRPEADAGFGSWLLESMSSGVLGVDASGAIVAMNAGAKRILGCPDDPRALVLGRDCREVLAAQPAVVRLLAEALRRPQGLTRAELALSGEPAGGARAIGFTLSPVRDPAGRLRGAAILFRDLAPIERRSEQERLRDRLAALGQMAAGLAHELRNPLASMEVVGGLLRRELDGQPEPLALLAGLLAEVRGIAQTVSSSLDFVRPVVLERRRVAAVDLLELSLATALARVPFAGRVESDTAAAVAGAVLCGDPDALRSALTALIVNALEAMAGRPGEMCLGLAVRGGAPGARPEPEGEPGREIELSVSDTGPGIAPALREKVFDPFFTTKPRGSGLGLPNAQKIALAHGGAIEIETRPVGCTFRLCLPVAEEGA